MKTVPFPKQNQSKPVGIWIRVSTDDQAKGDSPEHHERRAQAFAESRDWQVKEVYRLLGVSGKDVLDHPETKRMMADIRRGHISGLIFSKLARLARNTRQLLEVADFFKTHNADLVSLQESIDTSSSAGRFFYTMIAGMAEWEREEIGGRVAASIPVRAKLGKPLGGSAPYGFKWQDKQLAINDAEAPTRKLIHEMFIQLGRFKAVAKELNDRGFRARKGKLWTGPAIRWLLRDPSAKGLHRKNYIKSHGRGNRWELKDPSEVVYHPVPAIVTEEVWDRAYAMVEDKKEHRQRKARRTIHLFAGLVNCECGGKMYVRPNTPKYRCHECMHKIPIVDLEAIVLEHLKGYLLSPEEMAGYLVKADDTLREKETLLGTLQVEREGSQKKIARLYQDYSDEKLTGEQFNRLFAPLDVRLKQLDEEVPKLQATIDVLKIDALSADRMHTESKSLFDRWPHMDFDEKRRVVENLVMKIVVGKGDVAIDLAYFPSYEALNIEERTVPGP